MCGIHRYRKRAAMQAEPAPDIRTYQRSVDMATTIKERFQLDPSFDMDWERADEGGDGD